MKKKHFGEPVLRTPMIVAGHNSKYIRKAYQSNCDCLILDLEDGVPVNSKDAARKSILELLNSDLIDNRPIFVRINSIRSGLSAQDIAEIANMNLDGFILPKISSAEEIMELENIISQAEKRLKLATGYFKLILIIETISAVIDVYQIAQASQRIIALLLGAEDLLGETEGYHSDDGMSLNYYRSQVLLAARVNKIIPLDTPYLRVNDPEGLRMFIKPARDLGFEGMLMINPKQIEIAREMYTPSELEYQEARQMADIYQQINDQNVGVTIQDKLFVSAPTVKRALQIVRRMDKIKAFEEFLR